MAEKMKEMNVSWHSTSCRIYTRRH